MADTLGGKGSVVINRGVSGFPADKNLYQGTRNILDKYPDIKIAAEVYGKGDNAVASKS
jgi:ribose transport system substrate-binding protein